MLGFLSTMRFIGPNQSLPQGSGICLGSFDGLHLGHQSLLRRALEKNEHSAILCFEPHPLAVLKPDEVRARLQTPAQRSRVSQQLGVDALATLPFTPQLSQMTPKDFVQQIIVDGLRPQEVIVGRDFRFGSQRKGDLTTLSQELLPAGISLGIVEAQNTAQGERISSTMIRQHIAKREFGAVEEMLGRIYSVEGKVIHGHGRGRGLGIPTANISSEGLLPPPGVYAVYLTVIENNQNSELWPSVANIGISPTFEGNQKEQLEVHVIGQDLGQSLYDKTVEVFFLSHLRDEARFPDKEALIQAIHHDIQGAQSIFAQRDRADCYAKEIR